MFEDKRVYSRYEVKLETKGALPSGINFDLEVLDLSVEGAKLRANQDLPLKKGDQIFLLIKAQKNLKLKGEVRWIKKEERGLEFGVKFIDMDFISREVLSSIISQYALASLTDEYLR